MVAQARWRNARAVASLPSAGAPAPVSLDPVSTPGGDLMEPILLDVPDELSGDRVLVRPYEPSDAPGILAGVLQSQPELARRLRSKGDFNALDDARRLVARSRGNWILREDFVAGVFRRLDSAFCGGISLHPIDWGYRKM